MFTINSEKNKSGNDRTGHIYPSRPLPTPQNVINNLDILLKLVKQGADVAKLFLLLSNPAGAIIKIAANEIIKLCNDFKEIGVFYLFINPNDEGYGGQTTREFGLAIKQNENGSSKKK